MDVDHEAVSANYTRDVFFITHYTDKEKLNIDMTKNDPINSIYGIINPLIKKMIFYDNFIIFSILIKIFKELIKNFIIYQYLFVTVGNRHW